MSFGHAPSRPPARAPPPRHACSVLLGLREDLAHEASTVAHHDRVEHHPEEELEVPRFDLAAGAGDKSGDGLPPKQGLDRLLERKPQRRSHGKPPRQLEKVREGIEREEDDEIGESEFV